MAGTSAADEEEKIGRWRTLGELSLEEALRQSGASESSIGAVFSLIDSACMHRRIDSKTLTAIVNSDLSIDDAKCLLLATLGRGAYPIDVLDLLRHEYRPEDALNGDEANSLCVNLASNPNVRKVDLLLQTEFGKPRRCTLLAHMLTTNDALKQLGLSQINMEPEVVKRVMDGVTGNTSLESLNLDGNPLSDEGIGYVAQMLSCNTTLKALNLSGTGCGFEGAKSLSTALECNTSLERLYFGDNLIGRAGMQVLLKPFIHDQDADAPSLSACQKNTTITLLDVTSSQVTNSSDFAVESVASMIRTNKTLSKLSLARAPLEPYDWVEQIIPALEENDSLKDLELHGCEGLTVDGAFDAIMVLVQFSNTGLEKIGMSGTAIENKQGVINEELRVNKQYRGSLRNQNQVRPKSCRLVLCGYEFAGKTSICDTMGRIEHGTPRYHRLKMGWKGFLKKRPVLRKFLFGANAYKELQHRTRGFDIVVLRKQWPTTSIWDFAGQREYYALHDYMFPNVKNSCFLYVCSPRFPPSDQNPDEGNVKDQDTMREEFLFWMRFIASNSKPVRDVEKQNGQKRLPIVLFVLSKKDTLTANQQNEAKQRAEDIVYDLRQEFEGVIALSDTVEVVDAHSSDDVELLLTTVNKQLATIVDQPTEYAICGEVYHALEDWVTKNPSKPILSLEEFKTICNGEVRRAVLTEYRAAELNTPMGRETVLAYLNDVGKIIFKKGLDFIVVNPRWFGIGVLGSLINTFGVSQKEWNGVCGCFNASGQEVLQPMQPIHNQGFVRRNRINEILKKSLQTMSLTDMIPSDKLIELMIDLEMCFKEQAACNVGNERLFMPALFDDKINDKAARGLRKLTWKLEGPLDERVHYIYVGRRLECANKYLTFLTPGFFPRLQVVMQNFLQEQQWTDNKRFDVARNLIYFTHNGLEVFLEYSGDIDYFVDILVKSPSSYEETLEFIQKIMVNKIREFCASPQGCQGVQLEEAVIRSVCVEDLHLCADRKAHAELISKLNDKIENYGPRYKHTWPHRIEGVSDFDVALELLEGKDPSLTTLDIASDYISGDIPKHFYPTIDDISIFRKVEAKMNLTKVIPIKVHLMCDGGSKEKPHMVEGQPGRTLKVGDSNLSIVKYAVSLLWTGVRIVAMSGGVPLEILQIDKAIEKMFNTPEMPIPIDGLIRMLDHGRTPGSISPQEVLNLLKRYMQLDPSTQWLKSFLNLQDSDRFFHDFQLWKVLYKGTSRVGWFCQHHYQEGIRQRMVQSVPY